jgi:hypothetical protein
VIISHYGAWSSALAAAFDGGESQRAPPAAAR